MGHLLQIDDHILNHIDKMCPHPVDKALSTLNKWYEQHSDKARKDNLVACLEFMGRKDIADDIEDVE